MKNQVKRRDFIKKGCLAGIASCGLLTSNQIYGFTSFFNQEAIADPKNLNYCGYLCPDNCKMKKATLENNIELKKEAYKEWRIQEKYNITFNADQIICYGCKIENDKIGFVVKKCSVRNCAIDKGYECCIQCNQLPICDKELWKSFPDFHKRVIEMQKNYNKSV